ncbi:MAG: sugar ABC transporter ATP-binding protein [Actinobacteria bacterium]|nr:sugar ABC transporter ATP-binding protein [Actinomycetota bacterium]
MPPRSDAPARLVIEGMSRSFGETLALDGATLKVGQGEIHSLVGENGSGKSTMIKILSGVLRADAGSMVFEEVESRGFPTPAGAQAAGISTVFQETLIAPELTVRDNIWLGSDHLFRYGRRKSEELVGARAALRDLGLQDLELDRPMWSLSLAERQLTTVARAMIRPWRLLVLDEATSALDARQRDSLFEYLRRARSEGKSVLFTSHRMDEVFELADRITVLRAGATVASMAVAEATQRDVLTHMSGRAHAAELTEGRPGRERAGFPGTADGNAQPVLRVTDLALRPTSQPLSLQITAGEILGVAGLEGQGQVEFVESLCGLHRPTSGLVACGTDANEDEPVHSYRAANRLGIRYVPRDRRYEGLFAPLSVFDNFAITSWADLNRAGLLRRGVARQRFADFTASSRLVSGSPRRPVSTLSGGNQQKILLGRWIAMHPKALVLNDPLRGVDANTKEELYGLFRQLAATGVAIVFLSTEIVELLTLTDRIAVFHEGSLQAMLPAAESTQPDVVAAMFGNVAASGGRDD